ncbi:hypothetical protein [Streptomyces phaeoluteigriseus]
MSSAELARRAGLGKATLSKLEAGREADDRNPRRARDRPAHPLDRPSGPRHRSGAGVRARHRPRRRRSGTRTAAPYQHHDRWEPGVCRFVTSFSTTEHDVDTLLDAVRRLTT